MNQALHIDNIQLSALCERWHIQELAIFGSALRADFGPESDLDFLVVYAPDAGTTLFDEACIQEELEALFSRPVDLVSKHAVEESPNWMRRKAILEHTERVYVATQ